jgi:hypothetical protein
MAAQACCDCDRDHGCKTGQCRAVAGRCRALDADGRARGSFGRAGRDHDGRPFLTVARFVFESARPSSSASEQARPLSVTIRILASSIWSAGGSTHHAGAAALESAVRACARPNEIEEHRAFWPRATRCPVRLWRIFAELQPSDPLTKPDTMLRPPCQGLRRSPRWGIRKLCVIPPTIHPDTRRLYQWIGRPLHEVGFNELPIVEIG